MDNKFNRAEVTKILKEKGVKIPFGVTNETLKDLYAKSLMNSSNKMVELTNDKMVRNTNNKSEDIEDEEDDEEKDIQAPVRDDRFIVVKFLKNSTPYRKGDIARIERPRYEAIMKRDKTAITLI